MFRPVPTFPLAARPGAAPKTLLAAALTAFLAAAPAAGQALPPTAAQGAICGERSQVVERLRARYGETRRGYGLQRGASVVEVYASAETGSWTILVTSPNGVSCLVAAGQNWAPTPEEAKAELESPA